MSSSLNSGEGLTRRNFLRQLGVATAGLAAAHRLAVPAPAAQGIPVPVVIFSKAYQPLKLGFEAAAVFTAEAGLDGVDPPVRPDGEVLPERVADDLPAYVAALRKRGLQMPYLTTAITGVGSPQAEVILRTAKKLGVERYRLGFMYRSDTVPWATQLRETRARLTELAALNKEIGIGAVLQNHSPSGRTYVGGDLNELAQIVEGFDATQLGVAFDIAHALKVHRQAWPQAFEKIRPHLKVIYFKDTDRENHFVPLGRGEVAGSGFCPLSKQLHYESPISLHIEYEGGPKEQPKTRGELLEAVKDSLTVLRKWLG